MLTWLKARENRAEAVFTLIVSAVAVWVLFGLINVAFRAFTAKIFTLFDYGLYTNMIWNSGRGDFFRCLLDDTYLKTHLSFSLVLLGPFFWVFDHPFTLWMLQWAAIAVGGLICVWAGKRHGLRPGLLAVISLFWIGHHYGQAVALNEFHGVSMYMLLVPWLYYCLSFKKSMVWLPLILLLGLREDAFVLAVPMLIYVGVRDRWRAGYLYAGVAVAYGLIAMFGLYPLLAGRTLMQRRGRETAGLFQKIFSEAGVQRRLWPWIWLLVPVVPFFRKRGWLPLLVFPALVYVQTFFSGDKNQHMLRLHYPAALLACLVPAMIEAIRRRPEASVVSEETASSSSLSPGERGGVRGIAVYLLVVTVLSNMWLGFMPGGAIRPTLRDLRIDTDAWSFWAPRMATRWEDNFYRRRNLDGMRALRAAKELPKKGTVICYWKTAGFCANRADFMCWRKFRPARHSFDIVFSGLGELNTESASKAKRRHAKRCRELLQGKEFGVQYFDGHYMILERGYSPARNAEVLVAYERSARTVRFKDMRVHEHARRGIDNVIEGDVEMRYWEGDGVRAPITLAFGIGLPLQAGSYRAEYRLRSKRPRREVKGGWGRLSLHVLNQSEALAEADVEKIPAEGDVFRTQTLTFELAAPASIEPRATGGDAELWLHTVEFVRIAEQGSTPTGDD